MERKTDSGTICKAGSSIERRFIAVQTAIIAISMTFVAISTGILTTRFRISPADVIKEVHEIDRKLDVAHDDIRDLKDELTKEFVRKDELRMLLDFKKEQKRD